MSEDILDTYYVRCKETNYYTVQIKAASKQHAKEMMLATADIGTPLNIPVEDTLFDIIEINQRN
jgi:hypothetical protein|tara:strand:- start:592 stop:783 length:192 start_codon:yes stop_codon:yes gene_type:complete